MIGRIGSKATTRRPASIAGLAQMHGVTFPQSFARQLQRDRLNGNGRSGGMMNGRLTAFVSKATVDGRSPTPLGNHG